MALHWRPVGPEPAQTYWWRRALVLAGVLVLLAVSASLAAGLSTGDDRVRTAPEVRPSVLIGPTAASAPPSPTVGPCQPEALTLQASAEQSSYPVGDRPRLSLQITNTGSEPCTRDLGQAAVEVIVFSGSDRIWSSDDCAPGGPIALRTLAPGVAETVSATWTGSRSAPGCPGDQTAARAGTYRVDGRVGQLSFQGRAFRLTG